MRRRFMTHYHVLWTVSALLTLLDVAGCKTNAGRKPTPAQVAEMIEPNIISVHAYMSAVDCWIWNADRTAPQGVVIKAMYLQGGSSGKGVFGDGIIRPKLYVMERDREGKRQWHLVKEWPFSVKKAMPFRTKQEYLPGWGYRLHLPWGDEIDLCGREIRLIVEFERKDGIVVRSGKTDRKVPLRGI